jgi:hypothetical protein
MRRRGPRIAALVTATVALAVYLPRQCPTLALVGDSAEIVTAAAVWGVPHAPGYPLYVLVGHLFSKLPFLEIAHRVHLTAALFHAAAAALVAMATTRITRSTIAGIAAGLCLAFARAFLLGSLAAEVIPVSDFFLALLFWLGVEVHLRAPGDEVGKPLLALFGAAGLSVAHHHLALLMFPAIAVLAGPEAVAWVRLRPRRVAALLLLAAATYLGSYALVPLAASRRPAVSWGDVYDVKSLVRLALRRDYGGPFRPNKKAVIGTPSERFFYWGQLVLESIGAAGVVVVVLGGVGVRRRARRPMFAAIVGVIGTGPTFYLLGTLPETFEASIAMSARFVTASLVPLALMAGVGLGRAEAVMRRRRVGRLRFAMLVLPAAMLFANRDVSMRADRRGIAFAHDLLAPTEDDALVMLRGDHAIQAAEYVCAVERACGDRIVMAPGELFMAWKNAQVRREYPELAIDPPELATSKRIVRIVEGELGRRPVYMLPELYLRDEELSARYPILPMRLLVRVYPDDGAAARDRERFLREARDLADGRCEGCSMRASDLIHPSFEAQLVDMYVAALQNHALYSRRVGEGPALAQKLFSRVHAMDDGGFSALDYLY